MTLPHPKLPANSAVVLSSNPVFARLLAPLQKIFDASAHQYLCHKLSDWDWLQTGIYRVLDDQSSGCAFLQKCGQRLGSLIGFPGKSHYFESCKSERRLRHLTALADAFTQDQADIARRTIATGQLFGDHPDLIDCLADYHIYAGDGHFHAASSHDEPDAAGTKHAVGHLYALNLRNRFLSHLTLGSEFGKKKPFDMEVLKRLDAKHLRQGAARGEKVLYIWDRAGIDFLQWHRWKSTSAIYFLSRTKSNMKLEHPLANLYDKSDPLNLGILSDDMVSHSKGAMIRRVTFVIPDTGEIMSFITNLPTTIAPGIVAHLYYLRWKIEKVFDEIKNKLCEIKAWGKTSTARKMQAIFITLTYNLIQLLDEDLTQNHGFVDPRNQKKRESRLEKLNDFLATQNRSLPLLRQSLHSASQLSVKFYRWLRSAVHDPAPWDQSVDRLKSIYALF